MKSNSEPIGSHIRLVDVRDKDEAVKTLLGLSIDKKFIPSVANTIGTNLANYKIVRKGQFACSLMQVRRDKKMPVALLSDFDEAIISPAYPVFEIVDEDRLLPEYLMMWMRRPEFDREACFYAVGGVRGSLEWEDFCNMELPVPSPEKQREIVAEYRTVVDRIRLNERLNEKLEETAQAIYRHWFVDFEFPMTADQARALGKPKLEGQPYRSAGGSFSSDDRGLEHPDDWSVKLLSDVCEVINGRAYRDGEYRREGTKIIRIQNLSGGDNWLYSDMELPEKKYVTNGALIFAWSATFGPFIWRGPKSIYHYHIWRLDCFDPRAKLFLYHYLKRATSEVSGQGSGSIFSHITKALMEEQLVVYPDERTISSFAMLSTSLDKMTAVSVRSIDLDKHLKSILLSKMASCDSSVENAA